MPTTKGEKVVVPLTEEWPEEMRMKQKRDFSIEGLVELGPRADYFAFLDGEFIGRLLTQHAGVEPKEGEYTRLGRVRLTVEWLEEDKATEEAPPT